MLQVLISGSLSFLIITEINRFCAANPTRPHDLLIFLVLLRLQLLNRCGCTLRRFVFDPRNQIRPARENQPENGPGPGSGIEFYEGAVFFEYLP